MRVSQIQNYSPELCTDIINTTNDSQKLAETSL